MAMKIGCRSACRQWGTLEKNSLRHYTGKPQDGQTRISWAAAQVFIRQPYFKLKVGRRRKRTYPVLLTGYAIESCRKKSKMINSASARRRCEKLYTSIWTRSTPQS